MVEFVRQTNTLEDGALRLVRGCHEVKSAVIASTTVECLSDSSDTTLDITGIFSSDNHVQHEQRVTGTPKYVVYVSKVDNLRRVSTPCGLVEISVPNSVRELCDGCFKGCKSLRRVTFGPSSSLERIGVSCFEWSGVEEVCVPNSVRELCDRCFQECKSLRRVTFGPCSSLERIGVSCFEKSGVEEVSVPDSVRELLASCFRGWSFFFA